MADWSMLPCDILAEIAGKLDQLDDFIRFSVVCHSWNAAFSLANFAWTPNVPWLLLAENTNENPDCYRKVYDLSRDKCFQLKVPETFGARCWGSSYGWIAMQTFDYHVQLFNPLTKVRITDLPSVLTMPERHPLGKNRDPNPDDPEWYFNYFVRRLVVLKMPRNRSDDDGGGGGDDLLIAAIFGECDYLAVARPGDQSWTYIERDVEDVVCWSDCIYILRSEGDLLCCDIKGCDDLKDVKVMECALSIRFDGRGCDRVYLLDLCGDLVMVVRNKKDLLSGGCLTDDFDFYMLDNIMIDNIKRRWWRRLWECDIGKFSICVGHHSSMAFILTSVANCIFFTDDDASSWHRTPGFGGHDMGVYHIDSGHVERFYQGDDTRSPFCPPIFFLPKY